MSKFINKIKDLELETWIKYWIYRTSGGGKYKFALSDIQEGSNFYLENTIKRKFNIFEIFGKTTQDGTPTPENPVSIINLTGSINEKIQNANFWEDNEVLSMNKISFSNGIYSASDNDNRSSLRYKIQEYAGSTVIPDPYQTYKDITALGKYYFILTKATNADRVRIANAGSTSEFSLNYSLDDIEAGEQFTIVLDVIDNTVGASKFKDVMLLKGAITSTDYVAYQEQNISFPLEEGQYFTKGDYLADDGIHHKRGKVVLDGTENISLWQFESLVETQRFILRLSNNAINFPESLCSHFIYNSGNIDVPHFRFSGSNEFIFYLPKSIANTAQEAKNWLAQQYNNGTPVEIEYPLAEEVVEPFTEEQAEAYNKIKELYTYNEITNIDGDANLKIKYWERVER